MKYLNAARRVNVIDVPATRAITSGDGSAEAGQGGNAGFPQRSAKPRAIAPHPPRRRGQSILTIPDRRPRGR